MRILKISFIVAFCFTIFLLVFLFYSYQLNAQTIWPFSFTFDSDYVSGELVGQNNWSGPLGKYQATTSQSFSPLFSITNFQNVESGIIANEGFYSFVPFQSQDSSLSFFIYPDSVVNNSHDVSLDFYSTASTTSFVRLLIGRNSGQSEITSIRVPDDSTSFELGFDLVENSWNLVELFFNEENISVVVGDFSTTTIPWGLDFSEYVFDSLRFQKANNNNLWFFDNFNTFFSVESRIISINSPSNDELLSTSIVTFDIDIFSGQEPDVIDQLCIYPSQNNQNLPVSCTNIISNGLINIQTDYTFSEDGTVFAELVLLNSDGEFIDTATVIFHVNEITSFIDNPLNDICVSPSGILEEVQCAFRELFIYLFVPTNFSSQIVNSKDLLSSKIPFGFFFYFNDKRQLLGVGSSLPNISISTDYFNFVVINWVEAGNKMDEFGFNNDFVINTLTFIIWLFVAIIIYNTLRPKRDDS